MSFFCSPAIEMFVLDVDNTFRQLEHIAEGIFGKTFFYRVRAAANAHPFIGGFFQRIHDPIPIFFLPNLNRPFTKRKDHFLVDAKRCQIAVSVGIFWSEHTIRMHHNQSRYVRLFQGLHHVLEFWRFLNNHAGFTRKRIDLCGFQAELFANFLSGEFLLFNFLLRCRNTLEDQNFLSWLLGLFQCSSSHGVDGTPLQRLSQAIRQMVQVTTPFWEGIL